MIIAIHCTKCRVKGMKADYFRTRRATFNLTVHIVLVIKYPRKVFQKAHLEFLRGAFQNMAEKWNGSIVELNGESDHVHILLTTHFINC
ncbi:MAG: hypothetical protein GPJ21_08985 [Microcystis aeruginosa W13-11]|nr:hypothetical protein [Microcystis aeruginosa W13-11]